MLKQATESFFRLEFFKTPGTVSNNVLSCEPPTRQNRKLIFAKNLSLPLGEKMFYNPLNGYIHLPVFRGSNYSNKENMYFFWFQDESVLTETNLSGSTTGNTFFMTAKFYNAKDGTILDFTNDCFSTGHTITEQNDMYYQVNIDKRDYSYQVFSFSGTTGSQKGKTNTPIKFYESGGGNCFIPSPTPTNTPTPTITPTNTPTPTPTPTITPSNNGESTPFETILTNVYVSDAFNSSATEFDLSLAITEACDGTSNINSVFGLNGPATVTVYGSSICDASRMFNPNNLIKDDVQGLQMIILRQAINNFGGSGGIKLWYRKFQRAGGVNTNLFLPIGGCLECGVEPPPPEPIPQTTVNIYGLQTVPYNENTNNVQLIYQKYTTQGLGSIGYTTTGIQKSTTESGTYLTSVTIDQGGNLNLGVFRRVHEDGECNYREITANVFSDTTPFSLDNFTVTTNAISTYTGCGLEGTINGVSIPISSQSVDIYVTFSDSLTDCGFTDTPPLPCLGFEEGPNQ
jgi:hypothetical protein